MNIISCWRICYSRFHYRVRVNFTNNLNHKHVSLFNYICPDIFMTRSFESFFFQSNTGNIAHKHIQHILKWLCSPTNTKKFTIRYYNISFTILIILCLVSAYDDSKNKNKFNFDSRREKEKKLANEWQKRN